MGYGDFKDLPRKTACDKFLSVKTFNIGKNPKYNEHQCKLVSLVHEVFEKNS